MATFKLNVYARQNLVYTGQVDGIVEVGRQRDALEELFEQASTPEGQRLPIANMRDTSVPRDFLRITPLDARTVRITNLHGTVSAHISDAQDLLPGATLELAVPVLISVAETALRIETNVQQAGTQYHTLGHATMAPGRGSLLKPVVVQDSPDSLIGWFQAVTAVLESATSSTDFYARAARALVELTGLDFGTVALWDSGTWKIAARYSANLSGRDLDEWVPSQRVLTQVRAQKQVLWQTPADSASHLGSIADMQAVAAAPILDRHGAVTGVLYGDRRDSGNAQTRPQVTRLQAQLVETLACGIAVGLSRLTEERAAFDARAKFEQFFTPELSQALAAEPDLLKGRDAEVTLLFCDIRGFSRVSERLGAAGVMDWIGSVMGALSDCVDQHEGVLVDYIGDELLAMWGAPNPQANHAQLACQAALAMLDVMPVLNAQWLPILGEKFHVGIGINTGVARVGNTGSHRKFKYGPLGNSVNLASRVQGATKYLQSDLLMTSHTRAQLPPDFPARRLCRVRVINIAEPVSLYEIPVRPGESWKTLRTVYENALELFESSQYRQAARLLSGLLNTDPDDGPSLLLLSRVVEAMTDGAGATPGTWVLPGK